MVDNHVQQGNALNIDPRRIVWKRVVDMNDRELRNIVVGLGGKAHGVPRQDGFDITVASEVMAILCLASSLHDLKERLSKIIVAYDYNGKPVTAGQIKAHGAMAALLKDAVKPNLVQTLENVPAIIHGGPFANIAHGCNSVMATKTAMKLADYTITEAGFGADLGAEKFFDIKCRYAGLKPDAVVLVATVRALKMHGGVPKTDLTAPNVDAVKKWYRQSGKHIENIKKLRSASGSSHQYFCSGYTGRAGSCTCPLCCTWRQCCIVRCFLPKAAPAAWSWLRRLLRWQKAARLILLLSMLPS